MGYFENQERLVAERAMLNNYLIFIESEGLAKSSRIQHESCMKVISKTIGFNCTAEQIDQLMTDRNLSDKSKAAYISILRRFYTWANQSEALDTNPMTNLEPPKLKSKVPVPMPEVELEKALASADAKMRCWILLSCLAGLKASEIAMLETEDIVPGGWLHVRPSAKKVERLVPLHPELAEALVVFGLPEAGHIFTKRNGDSLQAQDVSRAISIYLASLNLKSTGASLRHYFAKQTLAETHDLRKLHELMGNSSYNYTRKYAAYDKLAGTQSAARVNGTNIAGTMTAIAEIAKTITENYEDLDEGVVPF